MILPEDIDHLLHKVRVFTKTIRLFYPLNIENEKQRFFGKRSYNPVFSYPALPHQKIKKYSERLSQTNINNVYSPEDKIRKRKLNETRLKLNLIANRGSPGILNISKKLYRIKLDKKSLNSALIDSKTKNSFKKQENLCAYKTARQFQKNLHSMNIDNWKTVVSNRRDFYFQVRYKKLLIRISRDLCWDYGGLDSIIAHEIDGHVIRSVNALRQKSKLFQEPLPFYIKTEEGLATYLSGYCSKNSALARKHHAIKYLACVFAQKNSFRETYNFLIDHGFTNNLAFQRTVRIKRGFEDTSLPGFFAREATYYEGMLEVKNYLENKGDIRKLYAGKIGLDDINITSLPDNQIIPARIQKSPFSD